MNGERELSAHLGALADERRFVVNEKVPQANGKPPRKVPRDPGNLCVAVDATNRKNWRTLAEACEAAAPLGERAGVGIAHGPLPDGRVLVGVDLDAGRDRETGELDPWAAGIVARLSDFYWEVSASGLGVKGVGIVMEEDDAALAEAMGGRNICKLWHEPRPNLPKDAEIALYRDKGWFDLTGNHLPGTASTVREANAEPLIRLAQWDRREFRHLPSGGKREGGKDTSGSGKLLRLAGETRRMGGMEEEFRQRAEESGDPDIAAHLSKGNRDRALERAWAKAMRDDPSGGGALLFIVMEESDNDNPFGATQRAVAMSVKGRHGARMRFCRTTRRAYFWKGHTWRPDERGAIRSWIGDACTALRAVAGGRLASLENYTTVEGAEKWLRDNRELVTVPADWNRDAHLLGTPGGVVDLRTGEMRDGLPEDMICTATAVAPVPAHDFDLAIDAPLFDGLVRHVSGGDAAVADFLQRWAGYAFTGETREQKFLFAHGPGGTDKSVFFNALRRIAGGYGKVIGSEVLMATKHERHLTELAQLDGARFVVASEIEPGRGWAEARLKSLTGDDPISARFMRGDHFEFVPRLKLTIFGNDKPSFRQADDEAIRRRLIVLEFAKKPASPDPNLADKLREEWPAIPRWAINGAVKWYADGLPIPKAAQDAADAYLAEQDDLGQWLAECCEVGEGLQDTSANLWASWCSYASEEGVACGSQKQFTTTLARRGVSVATRPAFRCVQ